MHRGDTPRRGRTAPGERLPAAALALAAVAVAFFALPLIGLLWRAPLGDTWTILSEPAVRSALRLSVLCASCATGLSLLFGVPLAWLLARVGFRGRGAVRALCTLSMVLPPVVGGVALFAALGGAVWPASGSINGSVCACRSAPPG